MMIPLSPVERAEPATGAFEVTGEKITAWRDYFDTSEGSVR
jgi:limonene-1,2-epoxide hydrolase